MKFVIKIHGSVLKSYNDNVILTSLHNEFFSTIVKDKTFNDCILEVDDDVFDINSLYKVVVNVKNVGKFYFFYHKNDLLNDLIQDIKELSLIDCKPLENTIDKVTKLIALASNKYLSFVVFYGCVEGHDINELISSFYQDKYTHLFIIKQKYIDEEILNKKTILQLLILYPYRWLVVLFSGIVLFLALLLGITYIYYGNLIAVVVLFITFFFSLIGLSIGNYDVYRKNKKDSTAKELVMCIVIDVISISGGLGLFAQIFKLIKKEDAPMPIFCILFLCFVGVFAYLLLFNLVLALFKRRNKIAHNESF